MRIAELERAGALTNAQAAVIAKAVAEREVTRAPGRAIDRVRDARWCAADLDGALADRMRIHDAAGAEAALVRLEIHSLDPSDARDRLGDPEPLWRAVATRGLVRPRDQSARAMALLSPDPAIRIEAVRASSEAMDPADVAALSEAARLDPEPLVRTEAVRALASSRDPSAPHVVATLRDLWPRADDGLRGDIARAWANSPLWEAGGREALGTVLAADRGPGVVEGAASVLRRKDAGALLSHDAVGQLALAIAEGSPSARQQALALAPLDEPVLRSAIQSAALDRGPEIRVAALSRLLEVDRSRAADLEELARPGSPVAPQARLALARGADRRIQAWLEDALRDPKRGDRLLAATALAELGTAARAAPLLADDSPTVRLRAACTIMTGARVAR
jgi:hypothetical protein